MTIHRALWCEYIERCRDCFEFHRFDDLRLAGDAKEIRDVRTGCMCDSAVGAWVKRWWLWGGASTTNYFCHYWDIDSPFVRCFKDVWYERCIGDILGHLRATPFCHGLLISHILPSGLMIWLKESGLPIPTIASFWLRTSGIAFTMLSQNGVRELMIGQH